MKTVHTIKLIPVLELNPQIYGGNQTYQGPRSFDRHFLEEWDDYIQAHYQNPKFLNIKPVAESSWLYEISKLLKKHLKIILGYLFRDFSRDTTASQKIIGNPTMHAPLMSGGYVLKINREIKSMPGTGCGLESIWGWEAALRGEEGEIWTGHDNKDLVFVSEKPDCFLLEIARKYKFRVDKKLFMACVEKAKTELLAFAQKIAPILNEILSTNQGHKVAQSMLNIT